MLSPSDAKLLKVLIKAESGMGFATRVQNALRRLANWLVMLLASTPLLWLVLAFTGVGFPLLFLVLSALGLCVALAQRSCVPKPGRDVLAYARRFLSDPTAGGDVNHARKVARWIIMRSVLLTTIFVPFYLLVWWGMLGDDERAEFDSLIED